MLLRDSSCKGCGLTVGFSVSKCLHHLGEGSSVEDKSGTVWGSPLPPGTPSLREAALPHSHFPFPSSSGLSNYKSPNENETCTSYITRRGSTAGKKKRCEITVSVWEGEIWALIPQKRIWKCVIFSIHKQHLRDSFWMLRGRPGRKIALTYKWSEYFCPKCLGPFFDTSAWFGMGPRACTALVNRCGS